jgi:hypothetical protein
LVLTVTLSLSSAFRLREARSYQFACGEASHERSEIPAAIAKAQALFNFLNRKLQPWLGQITQAM